MPSPNDSGRSTSLPSLALVSPTKAGIGGWGLHAASIVRALSVGFKVSNVGLGFEPSWALSGEEAECADWIELSTTTDTSIFSRLGRRVFPGHYDFRSYRRFGEAAVEKVKATLPSAVYTFTHVGLESLRWAKARGIPTFLDNPNTHILDFREAYVAESARYGCGRFRGHPTPRMVERMLEEYELADSIRVSSTLSKTSMVARGVAADKITVIPLPIDLPHDRPRGAGSSSGPLRVSFVGSLDLRKGFVPLLRAVRRVGAEAVELTLVGNTGDSCSRRLLARERQGLHVHLAPGDPRPAYASSDLFVLPTLEDGFGFVVAEAMAAGLPVVVTDRCGAAELVVPGKTGWIVPAGDVAALADALRDACRRRSELPSMGGAARESIERHHRLSSPDKLAPWIQERLLDR